MTCILAVSTNSEIYLAADSLLSFPGGNAKDPNKIFKIGHTFGIATAGIESVWDYSVRTKAKQHFDTTIALRDNFNNLIADIETHYAPKFLAARDQEDENICFYLKSSTVVLSLIYAGIDKSGPEIYLGEFTCTDSGFSKNIVQFETNKTYAIGNTCSIQKAMCTQPKGEPYADQLKLAIEEQIASTPDSVGHPIYFAKISGSGFSITQLS